MIIELVDVADIPVVEHDEGMAVAATEYERLLQVVDGLVPEDWTRRTDCPDWDVRDMVTHVLGFMKANADHAETERQLTLAHRDAQEQGINRLDAQTGRHVHEHAALGPADVRTAVHDWAPRALAGRTAAPAAVRAVTFSTGLPGESDWTYAYLLDVIFTRDVWMHRVDISRATGRPMVLTPEHDGRIVADVVADWARRHGRPFTLRLEGPAGGSYTAGSGGPELQFDAVEFCRSLSGRGSADVPLATRVPF
jgi:uncharacterized protein (TIGR03083 family)